MLCKRSLNLPCRAIKAYLPFPAPLRSPSLTQSATRAQASAGHSHSSNMELPAELDGKLLDLISSLHTTDTKAVVYVTGGAVQLLSWLLVVPGASNTVIEASMPYARESLISLLGKEPEQYSSSATAELIAKAAYKRAAQLSSFGTPIVGVGAACALASVPLKRGEHRAHVAVHLPDGSTHVRSVTLAKGARSRLQEDSVASMLALKAIAEASGLDTKACHIPFIHPGGSSYDTHDVIQQHPVIGGGRDPIQELLDGRVTSVEYSGGRVFIDAPRRGKVILPGSFNPLHEGHKQMLAAAGKLAGSDYQACYELAVGNADKGMLSKEETERRVKQFVDAGLPLVLTAAPLFTQKSEIFQDCKFVVGYDTAYRLVMPKYYNDSNTQMLLEFARMRNLAGSFIVAGRKDNADGTFKCLDDVDVPPELNDLFEGIPEADFRMDLSSTELRQKASASV